MVLTWDFAGPHQTQDREESGVVGRPSKAEHAIVDVGWNAINVRRFSRTYVPLCAGPVLVGLSRRGMVTDSG